MLITLLIGLALIALASYTAGHWMGYEKGETEAQERVDELTRVGQTWRELD